MRHLGTSKIGKLSAKKDKIYAQIRLPPQLADTIGGIADIYETEHNGRRSFLLITNLDVLDNDAVLQPETRVVKLESENAYLQRLQQLESEIEELKSAIFNNASYEVSKTKNSGLGEIRTLDPRRVKAMS